MEISIIVPVYNVEKYINCCIESILNQTFKDFELILVDDGSTDNSRIICDEYAAKDHRIVVVHKENGGLSSARNAGIEVARGEYIGFIDSDDFISENMFEALYKAIKEHDAEISMCRVVDCYGNIPKAVDEKVQLVYNNIDGLREILLARILGLWAVNKLYKRELFNKVRYPEGKIYEDSFVIVDLLVQCTKIVYTGEGQYYYIHRANSITTNSFSSRFFDVIEAWNKNYETIKDNCPEILETAVLKGCWARFIVLDKMLLSETKEYKREKKEIIAYLKKNAGLILTRDYFNKSRKVSMALLLISTNLYSMLVKINDRRNRKIYE